MHYNYLTEKPELRALVRAISRYDDPVVSRALQFTLLTVARGHEVARAKWADLDLDRREWRIPAVKYGRNHRVVCLSEYACDVLRCAQAKQGTPTHVFSTSEPSNTKAAPLVGSMRSALLRSGFGNRQSLAGFRTLFILAAREHLDIDFDMIDACLGRRSGDPRSRWLSVDTLRDGCAQAMQLWGRHVHALGLGAEDSP